MVKEINNKAMKVTTRRTVRKSDEIELVVEAAGHTQGTICRVVKVSRKAFTVTAAFSVGGNRTILFSEFRILRSVAQVLRGLQTQTEGMSIEACAGYADRAKP